VEIVPVIDLKGGIVVHARAGRREAYAPLRSQLLSGCEPVAVARALLAACGGRRLYVADLDALGGADVDEAALAALAAVAGELWVDAGAVTPARAAALARAGAARNVVGTESLDAGLELARLRSPALPAPVLSVDLRAGRLVSPRDTLAGGTPAAALPLAAELGAHELVVIDLARVGTGGSPPLAAVAELIAALPGAAVYAGGGVRNREDLDALAAAGAAGALVATALHERGLP
jgi:phosphoribosylformimino-5-aminoimidazole carboxamide ribotide isomerase